MHLDKKYMSTHFPEDKLSSQPKCINNMCYKISSLCYIVNIRIIFNSNQFFECGEVGGGIKKHAQKNLMIINNFIAKKK